MSKVIRSSSNWFLRNRPAAAQASTWIRLAARLNPCADKSIAPCCLALCLLFSALLTLPASAQSLADLARQEREKRGQPSATPRVYTNQDLHGSTPNPTAAPSGTATHAEKRPTPHVDVKGDALALMAMQTLVTELYPGSKVAEDNKLALPNGTQKSFQVLGLTGHKISTGWLYVCAVEFEEDQTAALQAMLTLKPAPPARTHIFVFYLDTTGNVRSSKKGVLDSRTAVTQLDEFHIPDVPRNGAWPVIDAVAWHWYSSKSWTGRVRFLSEINAATMTVRERLPVAISKKPNKSDSIDEIVTAEPLENDPHTMVLKGQQSGKSLNYPCPEHCVIDGERLLDSW